MKSLIRRNRFGEALDKALRRQGPRKTKQSNALAASHT
jgi:hypothetical protein